MSQFLTPDSTPAFSDVGLPSDEQFAQMLVDDADGFRDDPAVTGAELELLAAAAEVLPEGEPAWRQVTSPATVIAQVNPANAPALFDVIEARFGRRGADVLIVHDDGRVTIVHAMLPLDPSDIFDLTAEIISFKDAIAGKPAEVINIDFTTEPLPSPERIAELEASILAAKARMRSKLAVG